MILFSLYSDQRFPAHTFRAWTYPIISIHPWRNYEVEIVVKVVIWLTRKTSGNRIRSLQHRIKKGHRINVDGSTFAYDFQILQSICSGSFSFSIWVYMFDSLEHLFRLIFFKYMSIYVCWMFLVTFYLYTCTRWFSTCTDPQKQNRLTHIGRRKKLIIHTK
jgi:hypothetical protein